MLREPILKIGLSLCFVRVWPMCLSLIQGVGLALDLVEDVFVVVVWGHVHFVMRSAG